MTASVSFIVCMKKTGSIILFSVSNFNFLFYEKSYPDFKSKYGNDGIGLRVIGTNEQASEPAGKTRG